VRLRTKTGEDGLGNTAAVLTLAANQDRATGRLGGRGSGSWLTVGSLDSITHHNHALPLIPKTTSHHQVFRPDRRLPASSLHRMEMGEQNVTLKSLESLLKRLNCRITDIFE
jgi:hypothetical protein